MKMTELMNILGKVTIMLIFKTSFKSLRKKLRTKLQKVTKRYDRFEN